MHDLVRGDSARPLHVSAIGIPLTEAKQRILAMHGAHRTPTLLKTVDRLCRETSGHPSVSVPDQ